MAEFEKFNFKSLEQFKEKILELGIDMDVSGNWDALGKKVNINGFMAPNSMAVLPMEGCDGLPDGSPSDLTCRRYKRFSEGGAGLIWFEACAVTIEGRANPLQLYIHEGNKDKFRQLVAMCRECAQKTNGYQPVTILQLTHSGRYSRPFDNGAPMVAQHDPL